jgi:hypothetical protein
MIKRAVVPSEVQHDTITLTNANIAAIADGIAAPDDSKARV